MAEQGDRPLDGAACRDETSAEGFGSGGREGSGGNCGDAALAKPLAPTLKAALDAAVARKRNSEGGSRDGAASAGEEGNAHDVHDDDSSSGDDDVDDDDEEGEEENAATDDDDDEPEERQGEDPSKAEPVPAAQIPLGGNLPDVALRAVADALRGVVAKMVEAEGGGEGEEDLAAAATVSFSSSALFVGLAPSLVGFAPPPTPAGYQRAPASIAGGGVTAVARPPPILVGSDGQLFQGGGAGTGGKSKQEKKKKRSKARDYSASLSPERDLLDGKDDDDEDDDDGDSEAGGGRGGGAKRPRQGPAAGGAAGARLGSLKELNSRPPPESRAAAAAAIAAAAASAPSRPAGTGFVISVAHGGGGGNPSSAAAAAAGAGAAGVPSSSSHQHHPHTHAAPTREEREAGQRYAPTDLSAARRVRGDSRKHRGIRWSAVNRVWVCEFRGSTVGEFESSVEAARAYDFIARDCGVPESELNFPKE